MKRGRNGVSLPNIAYEFEVSGSSIIEELNIIEYVEITVVFDETKNAKVTLEGPRSTQLLDLLNRANLNRGTVISLRLESAKEGQIAQHVKPAVLARLNWFLHTSGYSRGFRGWKIAVQKQESGMVLWKSKHAWRHLKALLGI